MSDTWAFLSLLVSSGALVVSIWSWRAAHIGAKAAIFEKRFEIYEDAERYIAAWARDGVPDLGQLNLLVGAWNRSHFLCSAEVTAYLRKLWVDSVRAEASARYKPDDDAAFEKRCAQFTEHANFDKLRELFMMDLKLD